MSVHQELVIPPTLLDYIDHKQEAIAMIKQSYGLLEKAEVKLSEVARYSFPHGIRPRESVEWVERHINRRLWEVAFTQTGFMQLMDEKAVEDFEKSLEANPPDFTEDNIRSIFLSAAQDKDEMFTRGLVRVLGKLSDSYKTNKDKSFKLSRKAVINWMVSTFHGYKQIRYEATARLNDIDRVFRTLAGEKHIPRSLESALNKALKDDEVFENELYRIKGFKNSNLHIEFKRQDLIDKANIMIGDYFDGLAVGRYKEAK